LSDAGLLLGLVAVSVLKYICGVKVVERGDACASKELSPTPKLEIMVPFI